MQEFIGQYFGQYYGMDWLAMILSLLFIYYIGNKKRFGFIFGVGSCIAWIFTNSVAHIWPGVLLNVILIVMHSRGYINWGNSKKNEV